MVAVSSKSISKYRRVYDRVVIQNCALDIHTHYTCDTCTCDSINIKAVHACIKDVVMHYRMIMRDDDCMTPEEMV